MIGLGIMLSLGVADAVRAQPSPTAPETRSLDRPVGEALSPARIFLDIAWARAEAEPVENQRLIGEAFVAAQIAHRSLAGASIVQMTLRLSQGEGEFPAALRRRQETYEDIRAAQRTLSDSNLLDDQAALTPARERLEALSTRLRLQDEELARTFPNYAFLVQERPVSLDEMRSKLQPREALLYFADGDRGVYVFVLTREGAQWHRVALTAAQIEAHVTRLRCQLQLPACGSEVPDPSYDRARAFALFQALIAPALPSLEGKSALAIIPNRTLSRFPLAALVMAATDSARDGDPAALRDTLWLIDRFALTTVPSAAALYHLRSLPRRVSARRTFRGFGNPSLDHVDPAPRAGGGLAILADPTESGLVTITSQLLLAFPDIPYAGRELEALRRAFGAPPESLSVREAATESAVRGARLEGVDIIALATHGVLGGQVGFINEPSLIFTPPSSATSADDGVLTASEAARLRLTAELVILSACNTAGPGGREGPASEGLAGLARAFLFAGARSLIVSHWLVYDEAGAELSTLMVRQLDSAAESPKAVALQQAMIAVRRKPGRNWSHPSAWAPLVLVGDSR